MPVVTYAPADIIHWFNTSAKATNAQALEKGQAISKVAAEEGFFPSIKQAASAAVSFSKGAIGTFVQKSAEETKYELHDTGLESIDIARKIKLDYTEIRQIISKQNDRYQILFNGGSLTIKPVAHLVSGRHRVPIGWLRNGSEVPYVMLIEEISARCGIEIQAE